jgi:hypothetical protein
MSRARKRRKEAASSETIRPTRRQLLVSLGSASAAAAAALISGPAQAVSSGGLPSLLVPRLQRPVYRFTTRKRHACHACRTHHRFVVGASAQALNAKRAHKGCNCPVTIQIVPAGEFAKLFPTGSGVVDLRKL